VARVAEAAVVATAARTLIHRKGVLTPVPPYDDMRTTFLSRDLKMANISISNLQSAGLYLLADSETLIDSMKDLSENEL
jgi:hypothetical protein